jgi:oligopeptide/dipeptide ABC transporter ATP-binding protein
MSALLDVRGLTTRIPTRNGVVTVVNDVAFSLEQGECFGLVGESGSGKSMVCRSILRLPPTSAPLMDGKIVFDGIDLVTMPERELNGLRGRQIGMIVQDAIAALNPVLPVGRQVAEAMLEHGIASSRSDARERTIALMRKVGIPSPEARIDNYPYEFSGGMCQRVVIAAVLACNPRIILADEPTTALDVTIQDQILKLLAELQRDLRLAVLLVTHDMGVVAQNCQRVGVMYSGHIVELGDTQTIFSEPRHPYTAGLLSCVPTGDLQNDEQRLQPIAGSPPDLADPPSGCRFHPRCPLADAQCRTGSFPLREVAPSHFSACIRHEVLARAGGFPFLPASEPAGDAIGSAS